MENIIIKQQQTPSFPADHASSPLEDVSDITVIKEQEIPAAFFIDVNHLEPQTLNLREFNNHPALKKFIDPNLQQNFCMITLKRQQHFPIQASKFKSIIVITQGEISLSQQQQPVYANSIILIPKGKTAQINAGESGAQLFVINFSRYSLSELIEKPELATRDQIDNVDSLLSWNQKQLEEFSKHPFFAKLSKFDQFSEKQKNAFLTWLENFAIHFQSMLQTRHAACINPSYKAVFFEHLKEEFCHDELLTKVIEKNRVLISDNISEAIFSWFTYQLMLLDNVEKAALLQLVLEAGGDVFFNTLNKSGVFSKHAVGNFIELHAEADVTHSTMVNHLLAGYTSETYKNLYKLLTQGWEMVNILLARAITIVDEARNLDQGLNIKELINFDN